MRSALWREGLSGSLCYPVLPVLSSGLAVLRSHEPLALGRWHRVSAERLNKDGSLRVDGGRPVLRSSPGKSQGLNLHTLLYLGGVEPSVQLSPATNMSAHFRGCVGEVRSGPQKNSVGGKSSMWDYLPLPGPWDRTFSDPISPKMGIIATSKVTWMAGSMVLSLKASLPHSGSPCHFVCPSLTSRILSITCSLCRHTCTATLRESLGSPVPTGICEWQAVGPHL